ncbi:allantoate deiminase/N-carbamoyl-L-amino-acid hydrolase [Bacillus sp. OV322]|uniref:hydantoinase/carbamoylase family amidase n=1 Tax=Bacillus sp. OV322 TaxID=1882764 RepID=UPI0008E439F3|nr:hydantoinase/carbamoylase family amidase [Bacillus sp. OV322]SFC65379.1 allantoate deiminase/N-carbamoyl-L-amino-acid hydrolase [Bacillus sp. OV322]
MKTATVNKERLNSHIEQLGEIGKTNDNGVQRLALSQEDKEARLIVSEWMRDAGLTVFHDHFGNLIGKKKGSNPKLPPVMIGSHIDSVRNGGKFDGTIGVIAGIEIVKSITDANITHEHPIEVVAFCEEEGSRFNDGLFGSRGMVGKITPQDLKKVDDNNQSRYEALKTFGFGINPDDIEQSVRNIGEVKYYFELHIEQGPFLEKNGHAVGIVSGIAGPAWSKIKLTGEAGHAGTVPMGLRRDPLVGAAEVIQAVENLCMVAGAPTVGTVGRISAFPGGSNIIPESVEFSLDIRDIDLKRRNDIIRKIERKIHEVSQARELEYNIERYVDALPVKCSDNLVQSLQQSCQNLGINAPLMVSGAGHDAMLLAEITEVAMVFVRCRNGISHSPKEWADIEDITNGTEVLYETVLKHIGVSV